MIMFSRSFSYACLFLQSFLFSFKCHVSIHFWFSALCSAYAGVYFITLFCHMTSSMVFSFCWHVEGRRAARSNVNCTSEFKGGSQTVLCCHPLPWGCSVFHTQYSKIILFASFSIRESGVGPAWSHPHWKHIIKTHLQVNCLNPLPLGKMSVSGLSSPEWWAGSSIISHARVGYRWEATCLGHSAIIPAVLSSLLKG